MNTFRIIKENKNRAKRGYWTILKIANENLSISLDQLTY